MGVRAVGMVRLAAAWCAWTAASTLGLLLAALLFFRVVDGAPVPPLQWPWSGGVRAGLVGAGAGALLGACQAAVVGWRLGARGALAWVAGTALAVGCVLAFVQVADELLRIVGARALLRVLDEGAVRVAALALLGAAIGGGQWAALRRRAAGAGWWVLACAVALPATAVTMITMPGEVGAAGWPAVAIFGGATGAVLTRLREVARG